MRKIFVFLWACAAMFAQPLPNGVTKVTSVEGITEYRYQNGLRLLVFPDPSKATATVNITYLVGSRHEGAGEAGMAHLLEHMVFKGSTKHTNIPQELTEHGARPNGTTSYDRTNYFETFQASEENLKWALDLESDRMVNSFIKNSDLQSEFTVVRNEFERGENNPFAALQKSTMAAAYLWHSYGRSVIGNKSDIEKVPIDRLQAFYKKFYQPDNAILTVSGKIDEPKIVAMVNDYFAGIPKPSRVLTPTYTQEPTQDGERLTIVRRVGDYRALLAVYHIPDGGDPDIPALSLLGQILADNPSGRMYKAMVDGKKAAQVFASAMSMNEPGLFMTGAVVNKSDSLDAARDTMLATIQGVLTEPPTKEEVERAKNRQLKNIELFLRNSEQIGLNLSEYAALGDWRSIFLNRDRLRTVTPEDVQRVATAYLKASNRTLGEFIPDAKPDRVEIGPKSDLAKALEGYKGDAAMAQGEAFDPSPKNIESRVKRTALAGGLKLALLEKKTRGNSVRFTMQLHFGDEKSLQGLETVAGITGQLPMRGTSKMNRQQVQDAIDKLKSRVNIFGSATGASISIESTRENLAASIRLAGEIIRDPVFPESEFEQLKKVEITGTEAAKSEPNVLASIRLNSALSKYPKGDLRHVQTIDEELDEIKAATVAQVRDFYKKFYGASYGEVAIVGDFDGAEARKAVEEAFGNWKTPAKYVRVANPLQKNPAVNEKIETPDKANAIFLAALPIEMTDEDPDYPAMVMANYLMGGGFLNSRLAVRIRQKEGLSYGVGSQFSASSLDKNAQFGANAIAAPQNMIKVQAAFLDEVQKAVAEGFTAKELEAAKSGWIQNQQGRRSEDPQLAGILAARSYNGRTLAWDEAYEAKVMALTVEQVNAAFKKLVDPKKISMVMAGDFAKSAGK